MLPWLNTLAQCEGIPTLGYYLSGHILLTMHLFLTGVGPSYNFITGQDFFMVESYFGYQVLNYCTHALLLNSLS